MKQDRALVVQSAGWITIVLGVLFCIVLLVKFGEPGPFSNSGALSGAEIMISLGVAFYHAVLGILCLGLSEVMSAVSSTVEESHQPSSPASRDRAAAGQVEREREVARIVSDRKLASSPRAPQAGEGNILCVGCGREYDSAFAGNYCEDCGTWVR